MQADLFDAEQTGIRTRLGEQAWVLRGFALPWLDALLPALRAVIAQAPLRHMATPGGFTMSVALTNCGARVPRIPALAAEFRRRRGAA